MSILKPGDTGVNKKSILSLAIVLLLLSLPGLSFGDDRGDGNHLLENCGSVITMLDSHVVPDKLPVDAGFCLGLMQGMLHMNQLYEYRFKDSALFCSPDGITNGQAARVVLKYLRDHPEELHEHETVLAVKALRAAFPCTKKSK